MGSHWGDLLDGNRCIADVVDGGAHHAIRALPDHLEVVVALGDLEKTAHDAGDKKHDKTHEQCVPNQHTTLCQHWCTHLADTRERDNYKSAGRDDFLSFAGPPVFIDSQSNLI